MNMWQNDQYLNSPYTERQPNYNLMYGHLRSRLRMLVVPESEAEILSGLKRT